MAAAASGFTWFRVFAWLPAVSCKTLQGTIVTGNARPGVSPVTVHVTIALCDLPFPSHHWVIIPPSDDILIVYDCRPVCFSQDEGNNASLLDRVYDVRRSADKGTHQGLSRRLSGIPPVPILPRHSLVLVTFLDDAKTFGSVGLPTLAP